MTVKGIVLAGAFALAIVPALAQERTPDQVTQAVQQRQASQTAPDPAIQALGQMVQEAQGREAQALARAYAAQAQAVAEKKRADEAEAKLAKADAPK